MQPEPDSAKFKYYGHVVFTAVALLGSGLFVLRAAIGGQGADSAGMIAAGIAGFAAVAHLMLTFCEPLTINVRTGIALLFVVAAPIGFLMPTFARPEQGWPLNPPDRAARETGPLASRVVAPGDKVSISWIPRKMTAVRGLWRGTPKVAVLNAKELACPATIPSKGNADKWGDEIWTDGSLDGYAPRVSATFVIPDDAELGGKSLDLRVTLPVTYPTPVEGDHFDDRRQMLICETTMLVATRKVKEAYWSSWSTGATLGLAGHAIGGFMLIVFSMGLFAGTESRQYQFIPSVGSGYFPVESA